MSTRAGTATDTTDEQPGVADWLAIALLCACAAMSALLELLFIGQFYIGTILIPVVVLAALVGNVVLPVWGFRTVHRASGAVLPVVFWLIPILVLTMYTRPEGDLFVITPYWQEWAFYGLLLAGAVTGFGTIVVLGGGPAARRPPGPPTSPRPSPRPTPGGRPAKKSPRVSR
jgi:hypothetical protein